MRPFKQKLVTINSWYVDKRGKTQKLSYSTYGNHKYKDYSGYQYFGSSVCVTNNNHPPSWIYRTHPVDIRVAEEHGARSHRAVIFSNITGLKPKLFKTEPIDVLKDYDDLRTTGFFDHVSIWSDSNDHIYYLLEPYSISANWYEKFSAVGFEAIEILRPIAPYQGGCKNSASRSFLAIKWLSNKNVAAQLKKLRYIEENLESIIALLSLTPQSYEDRILEEGLVDE